MTQSFSKQDLINKYLGQGYSAHQVDQMLKKQGMSGYAPLLNVQNLASMPGAAWEQLGTLGRDLKTYGGALLGTVADSFKDADSIKDTFINAINSEPLRRTAKGAAAGYAAGRAIPRVGGLGGALLGAGAGLLGGEEGLLAGGKDLLNAFLSTYNLSTDKIGKGDINLADIQQGIVDNPFYAGLDLLSFGGAKALGKAGKKLFNKEEQAALNRYLTNQNTWELQNTSGIYKGLNQLESMPKANRQKMVESLTKDVDGLSKEEKVLSEQLKTDLNEASNLLINRGLLTPDYNRNNIVAQYAMGNLLDTNLLHKDLVDILEGNRLRPTASNMFKDASLGERVTRLLDEGENLYDNNRLAFLSQELVGTEDPLGEVIARYQNLSPIGSEGKARIIGRATSEQLGNVLDYTIKGQLDKAAKTSNAIDLFSDLINNDRLGIPLTNEEKATVIDYFKKSIERDIRQDRLPNFTEALESSGIERFLKGAGKQNLYKSLEGYFRKPELGVFGKLNRLFKKNILGNMGWMVGNRLGNWSMNAIAGVELEDYAAVNKYKNLIPEALKTQTSYSSYLNLEGESLKPGSPIAKALNEFKKSYGKYKNSDKTLADKLKTGWDYIGDVSNLTSTPIYELEAGLEYIDRAANYIRQAKRYAKDHKIKNYVDVLKRAKKDKNLYFKLNDMVNKTLGDYRGASYELPGMFRDLREWGIPFHRFMTQTGRVTAHNLANDPLKFASNVTIPARVGNELSNYYINELGLDRDKYEGGVPYYGNDDSLRIMSMTPTPAGIISSRLTDPLELTGSLNPLLSGDVLHSLSYQNRYGKTPTSPRLTVSTMLGNQAPMYGLPLATDYKPTVGERASLMFNSLVSKYNPYILATRSVIPFINMMQGKGVAPYYDTMMPVWFKYDSKGNRVYEFENGYDDIDSKPFATFQQIDANYRKRTPLEIMGSNIGVSTRAAYQGRKTNQTALRKTAKNAKKQQQKIKKNRGK